MSVEAANVNSPSSPNIIRFDKFYIRTFPGLMKAAQIAFNLLGFICIEVSGQSYAPRGAWFNTVSMTAFWFTGIMLILYMFHVVEKFYQIPWLKIEFGFNALWTFFYLLASALVAAHGSYNEAFAAAAFFGFCAMALYGYDAFLKFKSIKLGQSAQGERPEAKVTTPTRQGY